MKTYLIALSSILLILLPSNHVNGCGWSMSTEEYRFFLLQPDITNANELSPLFYSPHRWFEEGYWWNDPMLETNSKEWQEHTHYKGSWKDIAFVIYHISTEDYLNNIDSLSRKNSFVQHLKKKYPKELEYLTYARQCKLMINNTDPWKLNNSWEADTSLVSTCLEKGEYLYEKAHNDFLKLRISYQLLKLNFYHPGFGEDVWSIYETKIQPLPIESWIKASSYYYVIQNNDFTKDYQYKLSVCFDKTIDKRSRCVELFDRKHIWNILPFAKTNHEKAVMWVMYELQNPTRSLPNLEKIYALDPTNKDLSILITREINKIEDWLLTPQLTGQSPTILDNIWDNEQLQIITQRNLSNLNYRNAVYSFINTVIQGKKQPDLALWHVLGSYLCIMNKDLKSAQNHLFMAQSFKLSDKIDFQIRLNQLLLHLNSETILSPETEQRIMAFCEYNTKHPDVLLNQELMMNQLYLYIGKYLIHTKEVAKGIFFLSKTNRVIGTISYWTYKSYFEELLEHATAKDYDEMISILDKKNKSPFELFLTTRKVTRYNYWHEFRYSRVHEYLNSDQVDTAAIDKYKILDYKSMYYVQHDQLDSALLCVNQIPTNYWNSWPYGLFKCFPFSFSAGLDHQSNNDFYVYNKRQYLQRMCDLKTLIKNNVGDVTRHYYVLATGYFNMSYHGNYWIMNMPYKLSDEVRNEYYDINLSGKTFMTNYYGCQLAQENYLNAMRLTKDISFGALCAARANVCNIHFQEINWRLHTTYDEKKYSWRQEFHPEYGNYKKIFADQFKTDPYYNKSYYDDFVSNCYYYEHIKSKYY